jgi:hypothetical protein
MELRGRVRVAGLAEEPERRAVEPRRVRPAPGGGEDGLHSLVEAQQARDEVARRRDGVRIVRIDVETAYVFHYLF